MSDDNFILWDYSEAKLSNKSSARTSGFVAFSPSLDSDLGSLIIIYVVVLPPHNLPCSCLVGSFWLAAKEGIGAMTHIFHSLDPDDSPVWSVLCIVVCHLVRTVCHVYLRVLGVMRQEPSAIRPHQVMRTQNRTYGQVVTGSTRLKFCQARNDKSNPIDIEETPVGHSSSNQ